MMMNAVRSTHPGLPSAVACGLLAGAVFASMTTPALAQKDNPALELCTDDDAEAAARVEACTSIIPSLSGDRLADASFGLGRALRVLERYEESVAAFTTSLEARPDDAQTYRSRSVAYRRLDRHTEEIADLNTALRLTPDNEWAHYWRGHAHYDLGQMELAATDFAVAARLDEGDYFNQFWLGRAQYNLGRYAEAVESFTRAQAERPFVYSPPFRRGFAHVELGQVDEAVRDFRIAMLLDPNQGALRRNITNLVGDMGTLDALPPYSFDPAAIPREATNLTVLLPQDTRHEMEIAIGALANWFQTPDLATPEAGTWTREVFDLSSDSTVVSVLDIEDRFEVPDDLPQQIVRHLDRGLVVGSMRDGSDGPGLVSRPDDAGALGTIWPLQVGNSATGTGTYRAMCPPDGGFAAFLMGCGDQTSVEAGTYTFEVEVTGVERIGVPAGTFDTFVVRYREQGSVRQMASERERLQETIWWVAPAAGTWVRRTALQGEQIATHERVTLTY